MKSNCCGAELKLTGLEEGKMIQTCTKCNKPCYTETCGVTDEPIKIVCDDDKEVTEINAEDFYL